MNGRRPTRSSPIHWVEFFYSRKIGAARYCESATEKIACIEREFEPTIVAYQTQPFSVFYTMNGQRRRYTPDAMVLWSDGNITFEEVKLENWKVDAEFKLIQLAFYEQTGYPLHLRLVSNNPRYRAGLSATYAAWNVVSASVPQDTLLTH